MDNPSENQVNNAVKLPHIHRKTKIFANESIKVTIAYKYTMWKRISLSLLITVDNQFKTKIDLNFYLSICFKNKIYHNFFSHVFCPVDK